MTQDEIIEMARLVGMGFYRGLLNTAFNNGVAIEELEAFAKLVEDAAFKRWAAQTKLAVEDEREACAKVCDARYMGDNSREDMEVKRCADAIRNRSKT